MTLVLQATTQEAKETAMLAIFEWSFRMIGHPRPRHLFDFPSKRR